jgi:hypothetical protein
MLIRRIAAWLLRIFVFYESRGNSSRYFVLLRLRLDGEVDSAWINRRNRGLVGYAQTMLEQPV